MTEVESTVSGASPLKALQWSEVEFSSGLDRQRFERGIYAGVSYHLGQAAGLNQAEQGNLRDFLVNGSGGLGRDYLPNTRRMLEACVRAANDIAVVTDITTNGTPLYILDGARLILNRQVSLCRLSEALNRHTVVSTTEAATIFSKLSDTFVFGPKEAALVEQMLEHPELSREKRQELTRLYLRQAACELPRHELGFQPALGLMLRDGIKSERPLDYFLLETWIRQTDLYGALDVEILIGLAHKYSADQPREFDRSKLVTNCTRCVGTPVAEVNPVQIATIETTKRISELLTQVTPSEAKGQLYDQAIDLGAAIALSLRLLTGREYTLGIRESPSGYGVGVKWYLFLVGDNS